MTRALLAGLVLSIAFVAVPALALADPLPGEYTYAEAVGLGIVDSAQFERFDPTMLDCEPLPPGPYPSEPEDGVVLDDAPTCYMPPEDQDIIVIVSAPGDLRFEVPDPPTPTHIGIGSYTSWGVGLPLYQGGRARMEVSSPSVCHGSNCPASQHLYSRIAGESTGGFQYEAGWAELNDQDPRSTKCRNVDKQWALTALTLPNPEANQDVMCHRKFNLQVGGFYTFRVRQCASPGTYRVCGELWDDVRDKWRLLRSWPNVMRCEEPNGASNCHFEFLHEMATGDPPVGFFALNGGPDGLKMRDIRLRTAPHQWPLFTAPGYWEGGAVPYYLCTEAAFYRFRTFYGPHSCN